MNLWDNTIIHLISHNSENNIFIKYAPITFTELIEWNWEIFGEHYIWPYKWETTNLTLNKYLRQKKNWYQFMWDFKY